MMIDTNNHQWICDAILDGRVQPPIGHPSADIISRARQWSVLEEIGEVMRDYGLLKAGEDVVVVKSETNSDEKRQSNREIL